MHPQLIKLIELSKQHAGSKPWIGIQSNGSLLTQSMARNLLESGLDKICISIDSNVAEDFRHLRAGGEFGDIDRAFRSIRSAKKALNNRQFSVGIEFSCSRKK